MMDVPEIRTAVRAGGCHVADLLADSELDTIIMSIMTGAEACGYVIVQQEWSLAIPSDTTIADLAPPE